MKNLIKVLSVMAIVAAGVVYFIKHHKKVTFKQAMRHSGFVWDENEDY